MSALRNVGPQPSSDDDVTDKEYVDNRVNQRYTKPSGGIPKSDLDQNVIDVLDNAVSNSDPRLSDKRTPKDHTHNISDISGLINELDGKADISGDTFTGDVSGTKFSATSFALSTGSLSNDSNNLLLSVGNGLGLKIDSNGYVTTHKDLSVNGLLSIVDSNDVEHTSTDIGAKMLSASSKSNARSVIGAGTSDLELGTTSNTAAKGDHKHSISDVNNLQSNLDSKADLENGKVKQSQIPAVAITEYLGSVSSESTMLDLSGQRGDWCTRTDTGSNWQLINDDPSKLSSWQEHSYPSSPVQSVAGRTGAIIIDSNDISDATSLGRNLIKASSQSNARSLIGAGTSDLQLGASSSTAKAGNWTPSWSEISSKPSSFKPKSHTHTLSEITDVSSVGKSVATASSKSAARSAIGAGTSNLDLGNSANTAKAGNWKPSWSDVQGKPTKFTPESHTHSGSEINFESAAQSMNGNVMFGQVLDNTSMINDRIKKSGDAQEIWLGKQSEYDALSESKKTESGFIALIWE